MAAAATTGSRTVTNYDAANHIDADKQLKT
jgi:hypothetical protein